MHTRGRFEGRKQTMPITGACWAGEVLEFALNAVRSLGDRPISILPFDEQGMRGWLIATEPLNADAEKAWPPRNSNMADVVEGFSALARQMDDLTSGPGPR
jgi:hypothetical protein